MRTSVTLDEDVYELATHYAKGRGVTLGKALGELARKGNEARLVEPISSRLMIAPNGMLIFAPQGNGRIITNEMVKAALDEDED